MTSGQTGCYTVRALIIANDFSGATYYKTSDFGKVEIPFIPHINKISIRCGLTNNTIYMSYNSLGSPVPFSVTSKIHLVITKNGSSMTIDQNTQTGNITDGGTSSGISTTSIGGVAPGDTISITMYIYNKYGKNATVTVNNLVLSSDTEYYGIPS